jgi:hypothetical protein
MLGQVLWRQVSFKSRKKQGAIPQGTVLFVANITETQAVVIHEEMVLRIPKSALVILNSEMEAIPLEELQQTYHNKRASCSGN